MKAPKLLLALALASLSAAACSDDDDDGGSPAQRMGVGAACDGGDDCPADLTLQCLDFKGGYCGLEDCAADADCPRGSACVEHEDGQNYCFLICRDKVDCNWTRPADAESNCSANVTFTDGNSGFKACVPPS